jgi:hypothetical protein
MQRRQGSITVRKKLKGLDRRVNGLIRAARSNPKAQRQPKPIAAENAPALAVRALAKFASKSMQSRPAAFIPEKEVGVKRRQRLDQFMIAEFQRERRQIRSDDVRPART